MQLIYCVYTTTMTIVLIHHLRLSHWDSGAVSVGVMRGNGGSRIAVVGKEVHQSPVHPSYYTEVSSLPACCLILLKLLTSQLELTRQILPVWTESAAGTDANTLQMIEEGRGAKQVINIEYVIPACIGLDQLNHNIMMTLISRGQLLFALIDIEAEEVEIAAEAPDLKSPSSRFRLHILLHIITTLEWYHSLIHH